MKKPKIVHLILFIGFIIFVTISFLTDFQSGQKAGLSFAKVLFSMLKILPFAFILIALFEVWIKRETVIKHLGKDSGLKAYLWVLILAGFSVGGLFVALPLAETLHKKGASLSVIFAYLGFAGIVRIPMTIFEISFLGLEFTAVRLLVTIPLYLFFGMFFGKILEKRGYQINFNIDEKK
jgi:uncharacterized membrane protein YraQ (UPF0718 family)